MAIKRKKQAHAIAKLAAGFAAEKNGENILILDLRGLTNICEFFVTVSAMSNTRMRAIADAVEDGLFSHGIRPFHVEGRNNSSWTLLDFSDVIVHIFHKDLRDFYALERLWADAPIEKFTPKCPKKTRPKKSQKS
jgi:ribosome-associated protein